MSPGPVATSSRMNRWPRTDGVSVVDAATVEPLAREWEDGRNGQDVDTIVEPFGPEVVSSSLFVSRLTADAEISTIEGLDAVRRYVGDSFERATSGIRSTLAASYAGADSVVLVYTVHHSERGDRPAST